MPKTGYIPTIRCRIHDHKAKETAIFFVLQKDGVKYKIFPGEKIAPPEWDLKRERAKTGMNNRKNLSLNDRLNEWEKVIRHTWENNIRSGFSPDTFRQLVIDAMKGTETLGLVEWISRYVKDPETATNQVDELGDAQKQLLYNFVTKIEVSPYILKAAKGEKLIYVPLLEFAKIYMEERVKKGTYKRRSANMLIACIKAMHAYEKAYGQFDYNTITWEWLETWKEFSYSDFNFPMQWNGSVIQYEKKEWEQNYASKILSIIKFFVNEARKRKYTNNTITRESGFSIPTNEGNAAMLYFEDIQKIDEANLPSATMRNIRNLTIRAFCTGLRYSDWYKVGTENIYTVNGKKVLEVWAQKTGKPVTIPMLPLFDRILKEPKPKYIQNQIYNYGIRELAEYVGLTHLITWVSYAGGVQAITSPRLCDKVSAHDLRRSALTNFVLMNMQGIANMPDALIRLISGHSSDGQFQKYIRIGDRLRAANMTEEFLQRKKEYLFG